MPRPPGLALAWTIVIVVSLALLVGASCGGDDDGGGGGLPPPPPPPASAPPPPPEPPTPQPTQEGRESKVLTDAGSVDDLLNTFWSGELEQLYGLAFDPPDRFESYSGSSNRACGGQQANALPKNAYYCPVEADEYVAFDLNWLQEYLVAHPGGATTFLILAHEWGHAVQDTWLDSGGTDVWDPPYRKELNADCLAGVFLSRSIDEGTIVEEPGDADAIFSWLFEAGGGPWFNPSDHGTKEQRMQAFSDGFQQDTGYCRTEY